MYGRTHQRTCRDARGDATPARSSVVVAVAASAATPDRYIPVRIDIHIARVRHVPMEVIAVEAAAVCPAGVAPPATALEPRTAAAAASLHKNQPAIIQH